MRRWIVRALVAALSFTLLVACGDSGGGGGGGDGGSTSDATAPSDYMQGLCSAIASYQADLTDQNKAFQKEFSSGSPTPQESKDALVSFLDEIEMRTQRLVDEVEALGTPDVDNGVDVHSAVIGAFQQVVGLFEQAKSDIEGLPTDDPTALIQGFTEVGTKLQQAGTDIQNSLSGFQSQELSEAAADAEACSGVI